MRLAAILLFVTSAFAGDTLEIFGHKWDVRVAADWKVEDNGTELHLVQNRGPLPGPRRPIQFAIAQTAPFEKVTVEADVMPLAKSLLIVFAYKDEAHFDYAHLSTDKGSDIAVHNGIFHVYGGERVRISNEAGPASFPETKKWYHVKLEHDGITGQVRVWVDGKAIPALDAVDKSLTSGRVGIGSFDEWAVFRNVKIEGH
jgi:hypothetical protein